MEAWAWDSHWTLDVAELDTQHDKVMRCWETVRSLAQTDRLQAWKCLAEEMRTHFDFEDDWMARSGFGHSRYHKREHRSFLAEMDAVLEDAQAGFPIDDSTVGAVRGWLSGHVKGLDRDFARFLQEREAWDLKSQWELEEFEHRASLVQA
ncbi:MAG: hypothetical protein RL318_1409 [Fibrobacterota bacterium]|jgi:hemerythrin-like metal-binding protein